MSCAFQSLLDGVAESESWIVGPPRRRDAQQVGFLEGIKRALTVRYKTIVVLQELAITARPPLHPAPQIVPGDVCRSEPKTWL